MDTTPTTTIPRVGDAYEFVTYARVNYCTRPRRVNVQRPDGSFGMADVTPRSADDFPRCHWTCWLCHGENTGMDSVPVVEEIAAVEWYADNSTEVVSVTGRRATVVSPHGDACF